VGAAQHANKPNADPRQVTRFDWPRSADAGRREVVDNGGAGARLSA
jgi:hypothetical protein